MGRKRKLVDPFEPLPQGLYKHRNTYRTPLRTGGYMSFGSDYEAACKAYRIFRGDTPLAERQSFAWLLDFYLTMHAKHRVSARTYADYVADAATLKLGLGKFPYKALSTKNFADYRDERMSAAPGHVNKELSVARSAFAFAKEQHLVTSNPVDVKRAPSQVRERLISDAEYLAVYNIADNRIKIAMTLALRTLQRPDDVLHYGPGDVQTINDQRVLMLRQAKTRKVVRILIEGDLARIIDQHAGGKTFVENRSGRPFTVSGFGASFRKVVQRAGLSDFGLRDLRAKGATDLANAGFPIAHISDLLGHELEQTTRRYLKQFTAAPVQPNNLAIAVGDRKIFAIGR